MGLGGIGITQLLIILGIVILVFGTKKLANVGWDLGSAVQGIRVGFKQSVAALDEMEEPITSAMDDARETVERTSKLVRGRDK